MANEKFTGQPGVEKIRTPFAQTIFRETDKGLYYGIMYYDPADGEIHTGYSSYNPQYVFEWLDKFFVIDRSMEIDFQKVVRCSRCCHSRELDRSDPYENLYVEGCLWCEFHGTPAMPDEYCSDSERRCGDGEKERT